MTFQSAVNEYVESLKAAMEIAASTGEFTAELSYRPVIDKFFRDIAALVNPNISVIFEPRNQGKSGRPDWRFHDQVSQGIYGYIEAKGFDPGNSIMPSAYQEQIDRYLSLGHRVVLTDGIDFIFYDPEGNPQTVSLMKKPFSKIQDSSEINYLIENKFREFLKQAGFRRCTEEQLIQDLARRAVQMSKSILELTDLPPTAALNESERKTIELLREIKTIVESHHDSNLRTGKVFADFVAQVMTFGLLYAHRVIKGDGDLPKDRYLKLQDFWTEILYKEHTERLRPFRALVDLLSDELESLGPIGTWYDDCRLLLAHIELEQDQRMSPDYHALYERFLSVFDPHTRFDYGAFYTPRSVAEFAVRLTRALVDKEFGGKSLYESGNKLIDPCCGTGTFLEQLILQSQGRNNLPTFVGFEILPAPYALSHYRISMLSEKSNYPEHLSIILTDTLSDELEDEKPIPPDPNLIETEQAAARTLSRPPLTLVIGNPPSVDSTVEPRVGNYSIIERLLDDFRPPSTERTGRQNIQKQVRNEFMKFLRWSCDKLLSSQNGVLAMVLPLAFSDRPSYSFARKWLAERFQRIWILDLDLDGRTGVRASSLFNTLQGRMLMVAITKSPHPETSDALNVFYHSISSLSGTEKQKELSKPRSDDEIVAMFPRISLSQDSLAFRPIPDIDMELYGQFWPLYPAGNNPHLSDRYIFARHASAIKLAPSGMLVHANRDVLWRRSRDIADVSLPAETLRQNWFAGQDRPPATTKFTDPVRTEIKNAVDSNSDSLFRRYAYRPFYYPFALISEPLLDKLTKAGGQGTRARPEVMAAFDSTETLGIAIAPAPQDLGESLHRFASFCWFLPDNDLCSRGNAHVFCNQFPTYKKPGTTWDPTPITNIHPNLIDHFSHQSHLGTLELSQLFVFYVFAMLSSDAFLDEFEGALFTASDSSKRPRIPVVSDWEIFNNIAAFGKDLANLEHPSYEVELRPGYADLEDKFSTEFNLGRFRIDAAAEKIDLFADSGALAVDLHPIPKSVLSFEVSGYNVVQQWLKYNSYRYTRASFGAPQYKALLDLLNRIELQSVIIVDLNSEIVKIVSGEVTLI